MSIEIENLTFNYKTKRILEDISIKAEAGSFLGVLGPNGTGKSTLLKSIAGLLKIEKGNIKIFEKDIKDYKVKEIAQTISYVPQHTGSNFPISVIDAVAMGRTPFISGKLSETDKDKVFAAISLLELDEFAFRDINELSGGERQKVLIARSIVQETKIMLLDEPTSSLDIKNQLDVLVKVKEIIKVKKIVGIVAIHDINLASMFCDYLVFLHDKRIYSKGLVKDVINEKSLRDIYGVETKILDIDNNIQMFLEKPDN